MSDSSQKTAPASENVRECPTSENDLSSLNDKKAAAIEFLLLGRSFSACARALGIDPRTLYRWRQEDAFAEELKRRRQEIWGEAGDRIRAMVNPSLDVMEENLAARYDRARFRAASTILRLTNIGKAAANE